MNRTILLTLLMAGAAAVAADLPGFALYKGSDLKDYGKKLGPKMDANKVATENLNRFGNHLTMVAHREGNGQAEVHEHTADVFVVQSGEATLVVGGQTDNPKTTGPGEIRGPGIKGGERKQLMAGDVVHIPAKMPHQLLIDKGKQFTYFVVKVETR